MKKKRSALLGTLGLLIVLILVAGCYKPAAPDVTPTTAGTAEGAEEEEPDVQATAIANATLAAQTPEEEGEGEGEGEGEAEEEPTETPTEPPSTETAEPTTETPVPATPEPEATPTTPPSGPVTHVVKPGENLFRIALRYGTTVNAIAQSNGIANPRLIYVGQELTIPSAGTQPSQPAMGETTYVVKPGENLFRIALRYNMSHLYLAQYNGIANPSNIYAGQVLRIPPH